jgi:hypothetical protein
MQRITPTRIDGVRQHLNKLQILGVTLISHFGYGAAMGSATDFIDPKMTA